MRVKQLIEGGFQQTSNEYTEFEQSQHHLHDVKLTPFILKKR